MFTVERAPAANDVNIEFNIINISVWAREPVQTSEVTLARELLYPLSIYNYTLGICMYIVKIGTSTL